MSFTLIKIEHMIENVLTWHHADIVLKFVSVVLNHQIVGHTTIEFIFMEISTEGWAFILDVRSKLPLYRPNI